jgi:hypothetical protein
MRRISGGILGISLYASSERDSFKSSCRDDMVQCPDAEELGKYARNAKSQESSRSRY